MPSSGMKYRVALVTADVFKERIASIVRVSLPSSQVANFFNPLEGGETFLQMSVLTISARRHIP
jgi:hypothetical protein